MLISDQSNQSVYSIKKKKTKNILSVVQAIAEHTGVFSHALGGEVYGMHTGQELRN